MRVASLRDGLDVFEAEHARGCHGRPWAGGVRWLELEFDLARVGAEERSTRAHLPSEPQRQGRDSSGGAERRGQCCDRAPQLAEGLLALLSRPWLHRCDVRPHPPRRRRNRRPDSDPALDHRQASPQGLRSHDRSDDQGDRAGPGGLLREHPQQGVPGRRGAGAVVIVRCVQVRSCRACRSGGGLVDRCRRPGRKAATVGSLPLWPLRSSADRPLGTVIGSGARSPGPSPR